MVLRVLSRSNDGWICMIMVNASVPFPARIVPIEPIDESKLRNPQSRMTTPERGLHGLPFSQNHLSCNCVEWVVKCILMQDHPRFVRCSAAYIIHMYIVDRLIGSMFTNGIGRTTDICCTLMFCCAFCSYTRGIMDEEGSFASIIRTFIIRQIQV